ncbi:MAG: zinc-dependent metalloprotease [Actinomycetota bacterium]
MPASEPHDLVDWRTAVRIGSFVAGGGPRTTPEERDRIRRHLAVQTRRSDELVRDFTGIDPSVAAPPPLVLGREGWIRANVESLRTMIRPVTDKLSESVSSSGIARAVASAAIGTQIGILFGYLSQKVLGQYDLMPGGDAGAGKLYFIGPNVVETERRFDVPPSDFRLWIALHEVTHRTQFTGVPWLRERVRRYIERSLSMLELDPAHVRALVDKSKEILLRGPSAWSAQSMMEILLTEPQRALLHEVQALMSVVEGHGMFVMNRVGERVIPNFDQMRDVMTARRQNVRGAEKVFQRAIGIDMKFEQYTLGERFCVAVAEQAGDDAVNKVWERDGENLPTLDEMERPDTWLARVGA